MSSEPAIPDNVKTKFDTIVEKSGLNPVDIQKEYNDIFLSQFIQKDPQFASDKDRSEYAMAILYTRYIYRPPVQLKEIIPIGFDGKRISKAGKPTANLFVLMSDVGGIGLRRIVLTGEVADAYKNISLFSKYTVKLGTFKDSEDMIADNRARFENPMALKLSPQQIIEKVGIVRTSIADANKHLSKVDKNPTSGKSYAVTTDWRVVRGLIARRNIFKKEDGSEGGAYTIVDVENREPRINPDTGEIVIPELSVWISPELMVYGEESECDFVGTLVDSVDKRTNQKRVTMNAYLVVPIHARKVEVAKE